MPKLLKFALAAMGVGAAVLGTHLAWLVLKYSRLMHKWNQLKDIEKFTLYAMLYLQTNHCLICHKHSNLEPVLHRLHRAG